MNKISLVLLNIFAGTALIVLSFTQALSLDPANFIFFSFVGFLFALYRPGWAFLLLIGMLPYETIDLAPESFGLAIRPYQWLLVLVLAALLVRAVLKRFPLKKYVPDTWDILLIVLGVSAVLSALSSADRDTALKLSTVLFSFIALYFVCRLFIRHVDDARMVLPFLLSSFALVACYAIVQNILFLSGMESLEVMPGRSNATFAEADWLGGYLSMMVTLLGALIVSPALVARYAPLRTMRMIFSGLLLLGFTALILTVSRSAWLAAFAGIVVAFMMFGWQRGVFEAMRWRNTAILKRAFFLKLFIGIPFLAAVFLVWVFHLTPFDLFDRSKSISSGEQKITVACETEVSLPTMIETTEVLMAYGCKHIRLEEIGAKLNEGAYVTEVFRKDPNVHIRKDIYVQVIDILRRHWFFGIGFGAISGVLGTDARGAGLNASNLFLETWLGGGIIGLVALLVVWFGRAGIWFVAGMRERSAVALTPFSLVVAVTVFNLFNSGMFLGWFFVLMAFLCLDTRTAYAKN